MNYDGEIKSVIFLAYFFRVVNSENYCSSFKYSLRLLVEFRARIVPKRIFFSDVIVLETNGGKHQ